MAGIIAFNNFLRSATVVSESTETGFPFSNCIDGRTSTTAGFESGATRTVIVDFGSARTMSAVGFARSNLATRGATITFAGSSNNVSYTDFAAISPASDIVTLQALGSSVSYRYVRISVSGHSGDVYISDIYVGDHLVLPSNADQSFAPPEYCDNDEVISNLTYTNELAGLIVQRKLKTAQIKLDSVEPSWMESHWLDFAASVKRYPIYWVWKTGKRAFYCWPEKNIGSPKYAQSGKYFAISFKVEGITE